MHTKQVMKFTKIQKIVTHAKNRGPTKMMVELSALATSFNVMESRIFFINLKKITFKSLNSIILSY